jgi:hypothetical protein
VNNSFTQLLGCSVGPRLRLTVSGEPASVRGVSRSEEVTSVRQAAAVCDVSPPVVRRWLTLDLIPGPPWTVQQLHEVRDLTDPEGRRRGTRAAHGTITRWNAGCSCSRCRLFQSDYARTRGRRSAQERLPAELRQQLLDAIYAGKPFRPILRELELTSNQVFGLARADEEWSDALEAALTATRRSDLNRSPG